MPLQPLGLYLWKLSSNIVKVLVLDSDSETLGIFESCGLWECEK